MSNKSKNDEFEMLDVLDILLDENNTDPITMFNDKNEPIDFEQVAVIPYGDGDLYCILRPITKLNGVADNEAIVFKVHVDEGGLSYLLVETDESIAIAIFDKYYELLEEASKNKK